MKTINVVFSLDRSLDEIIKTGLAGLGSPNVGSSDGWLCPPRIGEHVWTGKIWGVVKKVTWMQPCLVFVSVGKAI